MQPKDDSNAINHLMTFWLRNIADMDEIDLGPPQLLDGSDGVSHAMKLLGLPDVDPTVDSAAAFFDCI